ncbi:acyl dehydratase [Actinomycetospora succinea]|uniref:Acyl dehydratase n=1 Tax=Actinomycetospora succinea TaxID=663603 RepID=A0A4R6VWD7_9PSEU|nr:MaoC/PaaZ C-terminal domain-containing protein [Actinomycetospora succinea]TDQ64795.1 acyl dehydratase [Actinomycetospora succinea]
MTAVGTELPPVEAGPITRAMLSLFAGASGDHNPIHIDTDVARAAGFDDVFAHGMVAMGYLGRALVAWFPQEQVRSLGGRFRRITPVHARPRCHGRVEEIVEVDGERRARLALWVEIDDDGPVITGSAEVALG